MYELIPLIVLSTPQWKAVLIAAIVGYFNFERIILDFTWERGFSIIKSKNK